MTAKTLTAPKARAPRKAKAAPAAAAVAEVPAAPAAAAVAEVPAAPAPQPVAQPAPAVQQKAQRRSRGINLAPKAEAKACKAGTKQARMVDLLFDGGASLTELMRHLHPWKAVTVKSGLSWDMNHQKGYGIRTTFESGYDRWLACDWEGQGTFSASTHPDDMSEAEKAALLAQNLADGYNPGEVFAVYHLVLPAGLTAPVPHTGTKEATE